MGLGDANYVDKMSVVNCLSKIALYSEHSTSSERLCKMLLVVIVSD